MSARSSEGRSAEDISWIVEFNFIDALRAPFARHTHAVLKRCRPFGLTAVSLVPDEQRPFGFARLVITSLSRRDRKLKEASIVYGVLRDVPGHRDARRRSMLVHAAELHHWPHIRLAVAHELGHLALGHVMSKAGNGRVVTTLKTLDDTETLEHDREACYYAVHLVWLMARYMEQRAPLVSFPHDDIAKHATAMWEGRISTLLVQDKFDELWSRPDALPWHGTPASEQRSRNAIESSRAFYAAGTAQSALIQDMYTGPESAP